MTWSAYFAVEVETPSIAEASHYHYISGTYMTEGLTVHKGLKQKIIQGLLTTSVLLASPAGSFNLRSLVCGRGGSGCAR